MTDPSCVSVINGLMIVYEAQLNAVDNVKRKKPYMREHMLFILTINLYQFQERTKVLEIGCS